MKGEGRSLTRSLSAILPQPASQGRSASRLAERRVDRGEHDALDRDATFRDRHAGLLHRSVMQALDPMGKGNAASDR